MVASGEIFVMGMVLPLNFTLRLMVVAPLALPPVTPLSILSVAGKDFDGNFDNFGKIDVQTKFR